MKPTALFATVLSALLLGCPEEPPVEEIGEHATLVINNLNPVDPTFPDRYAINMVFFKGPQDSGFGPNMLDVGETIPPGGSATFFLFTEQNEGDWVIQLGFQGSAGEPTGYLAETHLDDVITNGEYTWDWTSPLKELWRELLRPFRGGTPR